MNPEESQGQQENKKISPQIGMIAKFHEYDGDVYPAMITRVHSDTLVDLVVFGYPYAPARNQKDRHFGTEEGQWEW